MNKFERKRFFFLLSLVHTHKPAQSLCVWVQEIKKKKETADAWSMITALRASAVTGASTISDKNQKLANAPVSHTLCGCQKLINLFYFFGIHNVWENKFLPLRGSLYLFLSTPTCMDKELSGRDSKKKREKELTPGHLHTYCVPRSGRCPGQRLSRQEREVWSLFLSLADKISDNKYLTLHGQRGHGTKR